ncbi:MAG: hypothetical protein II304_03860 [Bacteroidales bacterium]|nr:hypothetical protein [Bacteroidales bacterium]
MSCKYAKKSTLGKKYVKCELDNSVRKSGCPCRKYKPSLWTRFKRWWDKPLYI